MKMKHYIGRNGLCIPLRNGSQEDKEKDEGKDIDTHPPRTTEQKETLRFKRILCWDDDIMTIPSFIRMHE